MINAVIVDDEIKGRQFLKQLVEKYTSSVKITGEAADAKNAIQLIESLKPDLVFPGH
jgi:YesN/AraC family two-component response regulator